MLLKKLIIMLNMLLMFTVGIAAQTAMGLSEEVVEPGLVTDLHLYRDHDFSLIGSNPTIKINPGN